MTTISSSTEFDYDIVVIGAGINGAGIARDASGRGLSVLLCEKDDIAQHTSSRIGGIRAVSDHIARIALHACVLLHSRCIGN